MDMHRKVECYELRDGQLVNIDSPVGQQIYSLERRANSFLSRLDPAVRDDIEHYVYMAVRKQAQVLYSA